MNIANKITLVRIVLIPVYVIFMYARIPWMQYVAGGVFIIAALSDMLDGHIARSKNIVTDFGKFLDPLADKLLVLSALILLCAGGRIPAWTLIIIMIRELSITSLRSIAALSNKVLAADIFGKLKTITQLVAVSMMHFETLMPVMRIPIDVIFYISVILTVFSGCNYLYKNREVFADR